MRLIDTLRLSTRMFKTNRLRTLLTILGISVGIGTILFLVSLGYGLRQLLISQIATSDAMLSIDIMADSSSLVKLDIETIEKIKNIKGITATSPMFSTTAQMKVGDLTGGVSVNIADAMFLTLSGIKVSKGEAFKDDSGNKIIVSSAALELFGLNEENGIGKTVNFSLFLPKKNEKGEYTEDVDVKDMNKDFQIAGIINDSGNYAFLPASAKEGLDIPFYSELRVKVSDQGSVPENIAAAKDQIIKLGFTAVTAMSETITDANRIFDAINIILSVFGAVALVVSAIGMFNTMTIALLERTQEIGIMKSLGASRQDIWKLFLAESIIIGFLGGMFGITIGYGGKYAVNMGINALAKSMGGQVFDLFYTPISFVLFIVFFSTIVGFITGLYPSKRAAALNPLEALRYK